MAMSFEQKLRRKEKMDEYKNEMKHDIKVLLKCGFKKKSDIDIWIESIRCSAHALYNEKHSK